MIIFFILTSITCSLDCLLCAFCLLRKGINKNALVIGITITVFLMCVMANYSVLLFKNNLTANTSLVGGFILIFIGIYNLVPKGKAKLNSTSFMQSFIVGFAVGVDGAIANFSISLMGLNKFYVPVTITLCHTAMIYLAIALAKIKRIQNLKGLDLLSPILLIVLGLTKIAELLF